MGGGGGGGGGMGGMGGGPGWGGGGMGAGAPAMGGGAPPMGGGGSAGRFDMAGQHMRVTTALGSFSDAELWDILSEMQNLVQVRTERQRGEMRE